MWSQRIRYALRVLVWMALHRGRRVSARELATENDIPVKYLEAILADLRTAGFVQSTKGATGGYALSNDPAALSLIQVVRVLEPKLIDSSPAVLSGGVAPEEPVLAGIADAVEQRLSDLTVLDAALQWQRAGGSMDYVI